MSLELRILIIIELVRHRIWLIETYNRYKIINETVFIRFEATVNVLVDMKVRPGNLQPELILTDPSFDSITPRTNVTKNPDVLV